MLGTSCLQYLHKIQCKAIFAAKPLTHCKFLNTIRCLLERPAFRHQSLQQQGHLLFKARITHLQYLQQQVSLLFKALITLPQYLQQQGPSSKVRPLRQEVA